MILNIAYDALLNSITITLDSFYYVKKKQKLLQPICSRFVHYYIHDNKLNPQLYTPLDAFPYTKFNTYWKKYEAMITKEETKLGEIFQLSKTLYEEHFFACEILHKCKKNPKYNMMCLLFDKYSVLFRNEVLCIFSILCVFRNKSKLQILDLY